MLSRTTSRTNPARMAYIRKLASGWRAEVQHLGVRRSKVLETRREAQQWALRAEAEIDAAAKPGGNTFGALASEYLQRVTPHKRSASWEERAVARLLEQIGVDTKLRSVDSALIGRWRDARLLTVSGSTVQREANLLRNMLKVARDEWRWIEHEPFRGVRLPASNMARTAMWSWPLIRRVLRAPRSGKTAEVQRAFHIALHTGLRLREVLEHRYDAARQVAVLDESKTGAAVVPVTRRAARRLPTAPFTVGANEASVLFGKLTRELLIEGLTFHDARASALTWLSRRMDVMTLARISRHKDLGVLLNTYYRERAEDIARRI